MDFRIFCRPDSQWGERKQGEGTIPFFLNLQTTLSIRSPLFLHYLLSTLFSLLFLLVYYFNIGGFTSHSIEAFLIFFSSSFPSFSVVFFFLFLAFQNIMKKKMRVSMDSAPSCSFLPGEEAMARLKHQYLLEGYQELLKETDEKRGRLQKAMQKKLKLLAEVKFLTKKYQSLANTSQAFPCKSKKQSRKTLSPSNHVTRPPRSVNKAALPLRETNFKSKATSVQTARKLIDLNQVSLPNDEEIEAFEVESERQKMARRSLIEGDEMAGDLKLSVCRGIGSGSNRSGKAKIPWQDQLALRI